MSDVKELNPNEDLLKAVAVGEDGKLTIADEAIVKAIEAHGSSLEAIKEAQKVINGVTVDVVAAMGKVAVDTLAAKKDLEQVEGGFAVGRASTSLRVNRSKELPLSFTDRSKGTKTVHGYTEVTTTNGLVDSQRTNVRKSIQGYATTKLGK